MRAWPAVAVPPVRAPQVRVHDSASQSLHALPSNAAVSLYVCGITPYDATHMGHAFTYVTFDLVNRVWRDMGLDVHYVQNVTDIDDPLLERAVATGQDWRAIAERERNRQTLETTFVSIDKAEIVAVEVRNRVAHVTVRFLSNLITATRNADGKVVDGSAETVVEVPDVWTFARTLGSRDPNWQLVATEAGA